MNEQLDEILDDYAYAITGVPKHWGKTDERKRTDEVAKAKLQRLIVEAKHGIVINTINLLNTEPIHTVERALLFDEERLTKEIEDE